MNRHAQIVGLIACVLGSVFTFNSGAWGMKPTPPKVEPCFRAAYIELDVTLYLVDVRDAYTSFEQSDLSPGNYRKALRFMVDELSKADRHLSTRHFAAARREVHACQQLSVATLSQTQANCRKITDLGLSIPPAMKEIIEDVKFDVRLGRRASLGILDAERVLVLIGTEPYDVLAFANASLGPCTDALTELRSKGVTL